MIVVPGGLFVMGSPARERGRNANEGPQREVSIAPFAVHVVAVNLKDEATRTTAESIYEGLSERGIEVLYDDRDERPGTKFKDADLLGMPLRVTVGEKGLKDGIVELRDRRSGEVERVPVGEAVERCERRVKEELKKLSSQPG